jgi:hypothetical protein
MSIPVQESLRNGSRSLILVNPRRCWAPTCQSEHSSGEREAVILAGKLLLKGFFARRRVGKECMYDACGLYIRLGGTCCFAQPLHDVGITVVEEAAGFGVQRPDRCHIFLAQVEVENRCVHRSGRRHPPGVSPDQRLSHPSGEPVPCRHHCSVRLPVLECARCVVLPARRSHPRRRDAGPSPHPIRCLRR